MESVFLIRPAVACAALAVVAGAAIGWPAAGLLDGDRRSRLLVAPVIGLGLYGLFGTWLFRLLPFTPPGIASVAAFTAGVSALIGRGRAPLFRLEAQVPFAWVALAALLALGPALAISPQWHEGALGLGDAVFDHGKAALVDEIVRSGVPVHNPFYAEAGTANLLNYYYLFYLVAASAARVVGASGWEADAALTGVVAFGALLVLGWGALLVGRSRAAPWWALALAFAATLRNVVNLFIGPDWLHDNLARVHHFEGWMEQSFWVPQHVLGGTLTLLAILGLAGVLRSGELAVGGSLLVGALVAAAYESSIWTGGFAPALVLPVLGLVALALAAPGTALRAIANLAICGTTAAALAADFILRNAALVGQRRTLALWTYPVLPPGTPRLANELGFWGITLVLDFGATYVIALVWLASFLWRGEWRRDLVGCALVLAIVAPMIFAQHVESVIANNDLGWRIVVPAVFAMTIVAAAVLAQIADGSRRRTGLAVAVALVAPGVFSGIAEMTFYTRTAPSYDGQPFIARAALWRAVRAVTPKQEAVLDNPADLASFTLLPGNIGWALLADRRSCAAGDEWLAAMAPQFLPESRLRLSELIKRVFAGKGSDDDLRVLARDHLCATLVVIPDDGLWSTPLKADDPVYKLADESPGRWRIYRRREAAGP